VLLEALEVERPLEQETRSDILDAIDRGAQDAAAHFVEARQLLLEADRAKTEFLAMLAHELRNPLAPIRNAVELLKRIGPPEPRLIRVREIIDRQVSHQARLLQVASARSPVVGKFSDSLPDAASFTSCQRKLELSSFSAVRSLPLCSSFHTVSPS
jgi:hypothetical protein